MKTKLWAIVFAFVTLSLGACASNLMLVSPTGDIKPPGSDKAVIVFMRSSIVAGAIGAELFEIKNGVLTLVGGLPNGSKIAHVTEPGEKVYMAYGTAADFMIANVEKGKTYYSIVRPNWGSGAFIPTPIKIDGTTEYNTEIDEFDKWISGTKLLVKKPDTSEWFETNKEKYQKIYESYWKKFSTKTAAQKQQRTLMPADGM